MTSFARRSGGFDPRWVTQLLQNYTMPYYILHIKEAKRLAMCIRDRSWAG